MFCLFIVFLVFLYELLRSSLPYSDSLFSDLSVMVCNEFLSETRSSSKKSDIRLSRCFSLSLTGGMSLSNPPWL